MRSASRLAIFFCSPRYGIRATNPFFKSISHRHSLISAASRINSQDTSFLAQYARTLSNTSSGYCWPSFPSSYARTATPSCAQLILGIQSSSA